MVSSCGFNAFPFYYKGNIAGWSHQGYMPRLRARYGLDLKKVPFDFPELIAALAPRAFFTSSPLHDANFEVEGVRACIDAARPVYELLGAADRLVAIYPDAEHSFPKPPVSRLIASSIASWHHLLDSAPPVPNCLTKKEMSVVYDTATTRAWIADRHRVESNEEDRLISDGSTRIRPPAKARMKAPWNDASSWWMTAS